MKSVTPPKNETKFILRGIHLSLTDATKADLESKAKRLVRHEPRLLRVRIDVERELRGHTRIFIAKGRVEVAGPDLAASVTADNAYAAINLLIDKLDRMLRKRASNAMRRRSSDDIRSHVPAVTVG